MTHQGSENPALRPRRFFTAPDMSHGMMAVLRCTRSVSPWSVVSGHRGRQPVFVFAPAWLLAAAL
jgi:hypothetical protein